MKEGRAVRRGDDDVGVQGGDVNSTHSKKKGWW